MKTIERGKDKYGITKRPYITYKGDKWECRTINCCHSSKIIDRAMVVPPVCPYCNKYMVKI